MRDGAICPSRSTTREIDEVLCTDDGLHVLVLCADGGVMYYRGEAGHSHPAAAAEKEGVDASPLEAQAGEGLVPKLTELPDIQREADTDRVWALRRVGQREDVVLLRAVRNKGVGSDPGSLVLSVDLLSSRCCVLLPGTGSLTYVDTGISGGSIPDGRPANEDSNGPATVPHFRTGYYCARSVSCGDNDLPAGGRSERPCSASSPASLVAVEGAPRSKRGLEPARMSPPQRILVTPT